MPHWIKPDKEAGGCTGKLRYQQMRICKLYTAPSLLSLFESDVKTV